MATPEENLQAALARAAKARSEGNEERAARWEASADRYRRIIDAKERIATAKANVEKIKDRLEKASSTPITPVTPVTPVIPKVVTIPPKSDGNNITPSPVSTPSSTPTTPTTTPTAKTPVVITPSPTPTTPSTVSATPSTMSPATQSSPPPPVKTAPIDTILFNDESIPIEIMADLIFENIGGQELINIARNDTVNGQTVIYQPIKNLTSIQQEYNPNNIVALQATSDKYFENFAIKFDTKVPETGTGDNGAHVYIDPETGSLVVEAINLDPDEQIELEITTSGTIYEADI